MKMQFLVYVAREVSTHDKFEEALKVFLEESIDLLKRGVSRQVLETGFWIEGQFTAPDGKKLKAPLYFYDARDFAIDEGVLVRDPEVSVADPLPTIDIEKIVLLYREAGLNELLAISRIQAEIDAHG